MEFLSDYQGLKIYQSDTLSSDGAAIVGSDTIYIKTKYVDKCVQGDCREMQQLIIGEWQHTSFGGSQDDPGLFSGDEINEQFERLVDFAEIGPPKFRHGPGF